MSATRPGLRRRLAEAVTITASILVAFGIDAWWDGVQQRAQDESHLENVLRELRATDELLDDAIRLHRYSETLAHAVLEMTSAGGSNVPVDSLDTLIVELYNSYVINPPTGALQAAILSGAVARLSDEVLKSQLLGWDSLLEDLLEEERAGLAGAFDFQRFLAQRVSVWGPTNAGGVTISGETVGERGRNLPPTRHQRGPAALLNDMEFENEILILLAYANASLSEATRFRASLDDVIERLETELE